MQNRFREIISELPEKPGIYRFLNSEGKLIYVGKAKNIKKRVSSYFLKQSTSNRKTEKLVSEIQFIEFTITPTEFDALLLENTFIKQYQPKYNILLKDDKTYPYICILNERFPRIISTRKLIPSSGEYFGPYTNAGVMNAVLELVRRLYTIRTCNFNLSKENIDGNKFKVCLEYHLGNCKAPCVGATSETEYLDEIQQAKKVIKGDLAEVYELIETEMQTASKNLEFEKAALIKQKLIHLDKFRSKHTVVSTALTNVDVITIGSDEEIAWVNLMQVKEGAIIYSINKRILKKIGEPDKDILSNCYPIMQQNAPFKNDTVFSNLEFDHNPASILVIPKIGDKKRLVDLSLRNAETIKIEKENKHKIQSEDFTILKIAKEDLRLTALPRKIECFDNSNLQGKNPVSSMVYFEDGKPKKSEYRHYNIKSVVGSNDFASMKEIVGRRYRRVLDEGKSLPDLIIVDGGKGQLSSACEALKELNIYGNIPIIGIAKNLEEIYFPEDSIPLLLGKRSTTLRLIQQLRNEAHRFGISFHRQKRSKTLFDSGVQKIPGIGKKTYEELIRHFKSPKKIFSASLNELSALVGKAKAMKILDYQQKNQ